ncbi:MAG: hypothetical protein HY371_08390 [Devosia nanyangense]|nr:hypothetical protein [Devosia nanyangense]
MKRLKLPAGHAIVNGRAIVGTRGVRNDEADATLDPTSLPVIERPTSYRVVPVSLFERDVRILDETVARQIATGYPASRSSVVRMALRHFAARKL